MVDKSYRLRKRRPIKPNGPPVLEIVDLGEREKGEVIQKYICCPHCGTILQKISKIIEEHYKDCKQEPRTFNDSFKILEEKTKTQKKTEGKRSKNYFSY